MSADAIIKAIIEFIGSYVKQFIVEIIFDLLLFALGVLFLKLITLWRYPRTPVTEKNRMVCCWTSLLFPCGAFLYFFLVNNSFI